jgi:dethiobiotin synthetase
MPVTRAVVRTQRAALLSAARPDSATPRQPFGILVVSGTGTGVGKTVITAALAALARSRGAGVAVVKPAQTGTLPGEPGDLDEIRRLTGVTDLHEIARFPAPLSPEAAARVSRLPPVDLRQAAEYVAKLAESRQLVLIEGAGGLAVRYGGTNPETTTIADLAGMLGAPVLVVAEPGLGTLNHTALTLEAVAARGLECAGVVLGAWPPEPDLAMRCNVTDLRVLAERPLSGAMRGGAGRLDPGAFLAAARSGLTAALGGEFDPEQFELRHGWHG